MDTSVAAAAMLGAILNRGNADGMVDLSAPTARTFLESHRVTSVRGSTNAHANLADAVAKHGIAVVRDKVLAR